MLILVGEGGVKEMRQTSNLCGYWRIGVNPINLNTKSRKDRATASSVGCGCTLHLFEIYGIE